VSYLTALCSGLPRVGLILPWQAAVGRRESDLKKERGFPAAGRVLLAPVFQAAKRWLLSIIQKPIEAFIFPCFNSKGLGCSESIPGMQNKRAAVSKGAECMPYRCKGCA